MQGARSLRPHNGPDIVRRHWLIDQGNWSRIARQFLERVWPAALISQGEQAGPPSRLRTGSPDFVNRVRVLCHPMVWSRRTNARNPRWRFGREAFAEHDAGK